MSLLGSGPGDQQVIIDSGIHLDLQFSHKNEFNCCGFRVFWVLFRTFKEVKPGAGTEYNNRAEKTAVAAFHAVR